METAPGKETLTVLRRLIAYSEKIFGLSREVIAPISDRRPQPRISTAAVVKSAAVLFWARMGSLNAFELTAGARFWKQWLGEATCSADTMGRVHALTDANGLRQGIHHIYTCLKRNKALPNRQGLAVAVLDGHESHASYLRHCSGCLVEGARIGGDHAIQQPQGRGNFIFPGALRLMVQQQPHRIAARRRPGQQHQRHLPVIVLHPIGSCHLDGPLQAARPNRYFAMSGKSQELPFASKADVVKMPFPNELTMPT